MTGLSVDPFARLPVGSKKMPKIQESALGLSSAESLRPIDAWISGFSLAFALSIELSASIFFVPATRNP